MRTAMYNATQAAEVLLQCGTDVSSKDTHANTTALNWAGGMNLADKDGQGMTARNWAERRTKGMISPQLGGAQSRD